MSRKISLLLVIGLLVMALGGCSRADPEETAAAVETMGRVSEALGVTEQEIKTRWALSDPVGSLRASPTGRAPLRP